MAGALVLRHRAGRLTSGDGEERLPSTQPSAVQQPLVQTVVDELTGRGTCPGTGRTALGTARAVDAVLPGAVDRFRPGQ